MLRIRPAALVAADKAKQLLLHFLVHGLSGAVALEAVAAVKIAGPGDGDGQRQGAVAVKIGKIAHFGHVVVVIVLIILHQNAHGTKLDIQHGAAGVVKALGIFHNAPKDRKLCLIHCQKGPGNRIEQQPAIVLGLKQNVISGPFHVVSPYALMSRIAREAMKQGR